MNLLIKLTSSKIGTYGLIITVVSVFALIFTHFSKERAIAEFERIKIEEKCFDASRPDPDWENMSPEERKTRSEKCMAALNRVTQVKSGPFMFSATLVAGIILIVFSVFQSKKDSEDLENESEEENDNKLS
jgi:hypothetical protein